MLMYIAKILLLITVVSSVHEEVFFYHIKTMYLTHSASETASLIDVTKAQIILTNEITAHFSRSNQIQKDKIKTCSSFHAFILFYRNYSC